MEPVDGHRHHERYDAHGTHRIRGQISRPPLLEDDHGSSSLEPSFSKGRWTIVLGGHTIIWEPDCVDFCFSS